MAIIRVDIEGFGFVKTDGENISELAEKYRGVPLSRIKSILREMCIEDGCGENYARLCKNRTEVFAVMCQLDGKAC